MIRMNINCPNCRHAYSAQVENLIDARNIEAKTRLVTQRLNINPCPQCGSQNAVATPLVYNDSSKQLLIVFIPMEVNLRQEEQEKLVGEMVREVTNSLPAEERKGYLFNPRRALTMQGLVDQILEADGVTPEMRQEQQRRVDLIQTLLETPPNLLEGVVKQYDAQIDARLMQTMMIMAQRIAESGQAQAAEQLLALQAMVLQYSSLGQQLDQQRAQQEIVVQEVAQDIQKLGEQMQRGDLIDLIIQYQHQDDRLQALVGLMRPAIDDGLLKELTLRISKAPAADRAALEMLNEKLGRLLAFVDQQTQMAMQQTIGLLQAILSSPNPEQMIQENIDLMDETLIAILEENIQEAERRRDINASARLKQVYQMVINAVQSTMRPELVFVNELLNIEDDAEAHNMVMQRARTYGNELLEVMDAVGNILAQRGDRASFERISFLRSAAERALN
jgi:hypothetical protein